MQYALLTLASLIQVINFAVSIIIIKPIAFHIYFDGISFVLWVTTVLKTFLKLHAKFRHFRSPVLTGLTLHCCIQISIKSTNTKNFLVALS